MAYGSGNQIIALDYNTFAQGGASVNHGIANINTIWGVGQGDKGYGQSTTLTPVTGGTDTVTATQWASMISRLNSMLTHQSGSGSGIVAPTSGATIAYLSTLSSSISTATTNRLNFTTNGADVAGAVTNASWSTATPTTFTITRTATWASADQARYFFNAGGRLIFTFGSVTNNAGNSKGADWASLISTKFSSLTFNGYSNARNGVGGTVSSSNTAIGYWNAGTVGTNILTLTSASGTADYSSNSISVVVKTNGVQGANGDVGTVITFTITLTDAAADTNIAPPGIPAYNPAGVAPTQGSFNDQLNLTIPHSITIRPPESVNLPTAITNPTIA